MNIGGQELNRGGLSQQFRFERDADYFLASKSTSGSFGENSNTSKSNSPSSIKSNTGSGKPQHRRRRGDDIEVDFYDNPTMLSRMILFQKYTNANRRCRDHPEEVEVWVCARRKSTALERPPIHRLFDKKNKIEQEGKEEMTDYTLRQLPIHVACTALAYTHDATARAELEQLIVRLVVTYPKGCSQADHTGKFPLHLALLEKSAAPETIAMLLMASPMSIEQPDQQGRLPIDLNESRMGKNRNEIRDMLRLGFEYWDQARQEARIRMKAAVIPAIDQSVASTSVMVTSQVDAETIDTTDKDNYNSAPLPKDKRRRTKVVITSEQITPKSWEQLEQRVIILERLLAEMHETNYNLAEVVRELRKTKKELQKELATARAQAEILILSPQKRQSPDPKSDSSSPVVVPQDDEMSTVSSVKFMEHSERIEKLESIISSVHSSKVRKKKVTRGDSRVSELSSVSMGTHDVSFPRRRHSTSNSLVSGLTMEEESYVEFRKGGMTSSPENEGIFYSDLQAVAEELESDNLSTLFHRVAGVHSSDRRGHLHSSFPTPRTKPADRSFKIPDDILHASMPTMALIWEPPVMADRERRSSSSSVSSVASRSQMSTESREGSPEEQEIYFPGMPIDQLGSDNLSTLFHRVAGVHSSDRQGHLHSSFPTPRTNPADRPFKIPDDSLHASMPTMALMWEPPAAADGEQGSSSSSASSVASHSQMSTETREGSPEKQEIYFPGIQINLQPTHVDSTISISTHGSVEDNLMSESSSIVGSSFVLSSAASERGGSSSVPLSMPTTPVELERLPRSQQQEPQSSYNFDISIPALDTSMDIQSTGKMSI